MISYSSSAVRDGNTYYYIELEDLDKVFVASIQSNEILAVLRPGDQVSVGYVPSEDEFIDISEISRTARAANQESSAGSAALREANEETE